MCEVPLPPVQTFKFEIPPTNKRGKRQNVRLYKKICSLQKDLTKKSWENAAGGGKGRKKKKNSTRLKGHLSRDFPHKKEGPLPPHQSSLKTFSFRGKSPVALLPFTLNGKPG